MEAIFKPSCAQTSSVTAASLASLLNEFKQNQHTGLLQFFQEVDYGLVLVMVRGILANIYQSLGHALQPVDSGKWSEVAAALPECTGYSLSLSPHALRLVKIFLGYEQFSRAQSIETASLRGWMASWSAHPTPNALYCRWDTAETAFVLPGNNQAPVHTIWAAQTISEGVDPVVQLKGWQEPTCQLLRCSAAAETDAWLEYHLHFTFLELIDRLLKRYDEFSGRNLVLSLCQSASQVAARRGWDIVLIDGIVQDGEIFPSSEAAAQAYRTLISMLSHHINAVMGRSLLNTIMQEILQEMNVTSRRMVQQYSLLPPVIFNQIDYRGYL